ncbi:hypothetical protein OQA88_8952 [Cercophora sp. LCS_1]
MVSSTVGRFNYIQWDDLFEEVKPYQLYMDVPKGFPTRNFTLKLGADETIRNIRGIEDQFNLDGNGFTVRRQELNVKSLDKDSIEEVYLPSLETMIRDIVGQDSEIIWFDWRTRTSDRSKTKLPPGTVVDLEDRSIPLAPVTSVHVDQSKDAAIQRVHRHTGERAEELLKGRVRIINVWRPYNQPVVSDPLAFCDGGSVPQDKLIEVDVVRQSYVGESYYPLEYSGYKWHYLDRQTKEEVLFMKMYDSSPMVKATCCPHASFRLSGGAGVHRESIEARALVFTPA